MGFSVPHRRRISSNAGARGFQSFPILASDILLSLLFSQCQQKASPFILESVSRNHLLKESPRSIVEYIARWQRFDGMIETSSFLIKGVAALASLGSEFLYRFVFIVMNRRNIHRPIDMKGGVRNRVVYQRRKIGKWHGDRTQMRYIQ